MKVIDFSILDQCVRKDTLYNNNSDNSQLVKVALYQPQADRFCYEIIEKRSESVVF